LFAPLRPLLDLTVVGDLQPRSRTLGGDPHPRQSSGLGGHARHLWNRSRVLRFAAVGTLAGLIDMAVVQGLVSALRLDPYSARLISYVVAATAAWALNRRLTFGAAGRSGRAREWARYLAVNLGGAAVNYAVYAALVLTIAFLARWPFMAVAVGSLAGMLVNFSLVRRWVFVPPTP
jgi:putative flippase GtrA